MSGMIVFVLGLFKFRVTLNIFTHFLSCTSFIFATASYRSSSSSSSSCCCSLAVADPCCYSSFSLATVGSSSSSASFSTMSLNPSCCPYPIFSTTLLYNKEEVSRMLCSLSASASHVAARGVDTAL